MSRPRPRDAAGSVGRTCVVLLAALGLAVGSPGLARAGERTALAGTPPTLAGAAAIGRAAVVTLKIPGTARVQGVLVDHWLDPDDALDELDDDGGEVGDFTLGSAVIIEASGLAITTARLGRRASALQAVTSDGRRLAVKIVGQDDQTDVAVLSMCCDARPFPFVAFGNSDRVRAGDWVIAIGAPFGLDVSATASAVAGVTTADADGVGGLIQAGGSVTAGYAGGPLLDTSGAMIGLVIGSSAGAGLALPSNTVRKVAQTLLEHGRVRRGWLGATGQPLDPALAVAFGARDPHGVVIVDVRRDSPAALAGLRPGDVVYEIEGRRFGSALRMARAIATFTPGQLITLKVWQQRREVVLTVRLGEEPGEEAAGSIRARTKARLGVEVGTITSEMGVVVSGVEPDGPAARAGIRRGDVIRELNGRSTRSMADFEEAVTALSVDTRIVMLLQRGASSSYVTFAP